MTIGEDAALNGFSVRALSYRNDYVGVYQHIEDTPRDLNSFLLDQGFAYGKGGAEHHV